MRKLVGENPVITYFANKYSEKLIRYQLINLSLQKTKLFVVLLYKQKYWLHKFKELNRC